MKVTTVKVDEFLSTFQQFWDDLTQVSTSCASFFATALVTRIADQNILIIINNFTQAWKVKDSNYEGSFSLVEWLGQKLSIID